MSSLLHFEIFMLRQTVIFPTGAFVCSSEAFKRIKQFAFYVPYTDEPKSILDLPLIGRFKVEDRGVIQYTEIYLDAKATTNYVCFDHHNVINVDEFITEETDNRWAQIT